MGCRRASSTTTLLVVILAVTFLLALDRPVAHARHLRSPAMSTAERSSRDKGSQGMTRNNGGEEHAKNTGTVRVEKGSTTGEGAAAGASVVGRGGSSPAAASAEKVVVARYGPRPHPKKHN